MIIADNVLREKLKNVYFLWGRGKTTIANTLQEKYGFCIYRTDDGREQQMKIADPAYQPYMCRDNIREYGVGSFWELPPEVIAKREKYFLKKSPRCWSRICLYLPHSMRSSSVREILAITSFFRLRRIRSTF